MTTAQEIGDLIKSASKGSQGIAPAAFLEQVTSLLRRTCGRGEEFDAAGPNFLGSVDLYFAATNVLLASGYVAAAEQLLLSWWEDAGERQLQEHQHISRANTAYKLTEHYLHMGDRGAALRWALLTHADDLLQLHISGGVGRQWLRTVFGMTEAELDKFATIANENLERSKNSSPAYLHFFAEEVLLRLAKDSSFERFFSQSSNAREFHFCRPYFNALLDRVNTPGSSTKIQGDALEELASYLFILLPGWLPRRNLFDESEGFETDILVSNYSPRATVTTELLGRHILVECKNWADRVGVKDVGYFLYRMRLTHCSFGVIFAKTDITGMGKKAETAARSLIRRSFHEDGNTCIVIGREDLRALANRERGFLTVLLQKAEYFRFGKPKYTE